MAPDIVNLDFNTWFKNEPGVCIRAKQQWWPPWAIDSQVPLTGALAKGVPARNEACKCASAFVVSNRITPVANIGQCTAVGSKQAAAVLEGVRHAIKARKGEQPGAVQLSSPAQRVKGMVKECRSTQIHTGRRHRQQQQGDH